MKFLLLLMGSLAVSLSRAAVESDLVSKLPGILFTPKFKTYSGYLKASDTKMLHYWFVESQGNPEKDPLVLWLNGGPGCSSLVGLLQEHGPYAVSGDGRALYENAHAWNKIANVLYLESPAGVGFSYTTDGNYTTGDDETAADNYMAIKYFLKNYPEYSKNDFYITGESYGGIYVPTLAVKVMQDSDINFKGMAIGNGVSDKVVNQDSLFYFGYYHGLYSQQHWDKLLSLCCNGTEKRCNITQNSLPPDMFDCLNMTMITLQKIHELNVYNMYEECYPNTPPKAQSQQFYYLHPKHANLLKAYPHPVPKGIPPCTNVYGISTYLNTSTVRKALHIPDTAPEWQTCSDLHYRLEHINMTAQYKALLAKNKYRIILYNGDVDMACNFLGEEWFIDSLRLKEKSPWRPWKYTELDKSTQVAGFVHEYQGLTFVTVKGSGHMVPHDKPAVALELFAKFIGNKTF